MKTAALKLLPYLAFIVLAIALVVAVYHIKYYWPKAQGHELRRDITGSVSDYGVLCLPHPWDHRHRGLFGAS